MKKLDVGAATAIAGVAIFQIHSMYVQHAGSLQEARDAPPADTTTTAHLIDADCLTGGMVLLVGGALAFGTGEAYPLLLAVAAFLLVAGYYHYASQSGSTLAVGGTPSGPVVDDGEDFG